MRIFEYSGVTLPTKGTPKYEALKKILKENNLEQLLSIDSYWLSKSLNTDVIDKTIVEQIESLIEKKQSKKIYLGKSREL